MAPQREFQLLQDYVPDADVARRDDHRPPPLSVPVGVSFVSVDDSGEVEISQPANEPPLDNQLVLEPFFDGQISTLLVVCPATKRISVNGRPAPRVSLLYERDQLQT
jgi:hypothetical protein